LAVKDGAVPSSRSKRIGLAVFSNFRFRANPSPLKGGQDSSGRAFCTSFIPVGRRLVGTSNWTEARTPSARGGPPSAVVPKMCHTLVSEREIQSKIPDNPRRPFIRSHSTTQCGQTTPERWGIEIEERGTRVRGEREGGVESQLGPVLKTSSLFNLLSIRCPS